MRVLHVVTKMDAGGIETLLMNFYRNIDRSKIQFDFLTHRNDKGFYDDEIKELGGRIYQVPPINPFKHNRYIKALDDFFSSHREYKIVHSHINTYSMYPLRAAHRKGVPIRIAHSHISDISLGIKTPFITYTKSKLKKHSTHNFACSIQAGKWLYGKMAISKNNFKVINNAIDASKYTHNQLIENKIRNKMNLEDNFVIGHIGRFNKQKNHLFLIEIFKEVVKKEPNTVLVLIGEGQLESTIRGKIKSLDLIDNVIFTGVRGDVHELLQAMDAFVFPSLYEGLGIVTIEAQAAGIPCVVSDNVPNEAFITDSIKSLSLKSSAEIWANNIIEVVKKEKENTYRRIFEAGYDISEQAKKLEKFYLSVANNGG